MKALKILARIIALPMYLAIIIIHFVILTIVYGYNWVRFGGEVIAYTQYNNTKTVMEVHDYLRQHIESQKTEM
jgi:exonuclease I